MGLSISNIGKAMKKLGHNVSDAAEEAFQTIEKDPELLLGPAGLAIASVKNLLGGRTLTGSRRRPKAPSPEFADTLPVRNLLTVAEGVGSSINGAQPFTIPSKVVVPATTTFAGAAGGSQGSIVADLFLNTATPDFQAAYTFPWPFISKRLRVYTQSEPVDVSANDADMLWLQGLHMIFSVATEFARTSLATLNADNFLDVPSAGTPGTTAAISGAGSSVTALAGVEWDVFYEKQGTYKNQVFTSIPIAGGGVSKAFGIGQFLDGWVIQDASLTRMESREVVNQIAKMIGGSEREAMQTALDEGLMDGSGLESHIRELGLRTF